MLAERPADVTATPVNAAPLLDTTTVPLTLPVAATGGAGIDESEPPPQAATTSIRAKTSGQRHGMGNESVSVAPPDRVACM